jgi:hypothetical protein
MAPPQISNNFRFRPIFPLSSPLQNEVGPSCIPNSEPSSPILMSPNYDKSKNVVDDIAKKGEEKKRRKMYDGAQKFQNP